MTPLPTNTDVLIVGAGPTGLALGCALAAQRIRFALVDRLAQGVNTSRAAVIHARTLEVLEKIGVTARLTRLGHVVPRFTVRDRDRVLAAIDFDGLPTPHPYTLMLPQQETERILEGRIGELGGVVHRGATVERVRQDGDGATTTLVRQQQTCEVRARYVAAADGMHSRVRDDAGIRFLGDAYEQSFVVAAQPAGGDALLLAGRLRRGRPAARRTPSRGGDARRGAGASDRGGRAASARHAVPPRARRTCTK